MERFRVIDSHTGGEPTRVVVDGLPTFGGGSISRQLEVIKRDFDRYRTAIIGEPRSSSVPVGAYLLPSNLADYGVIFFNNDGYLAMCGHGTIGVVTTLNHLGRLDSGTVTFETPAGVVRAELSNDRCVAIENVPSFRSRRLVELDLGPAGHVTGDVAYGGNWFFISSDHAQKIERTNLAALEEYCSLVRDALVRNGVTGSGGETIDHIELLGPSEAADSRSVVFCPGGQYDRSPCGTGTSARLACLLEEGKLKEGETYRVESIIGSIFRGSIRRVGRELIPTIVGQAFINGDTTILLDPEDPFVWGIL